MTPKRLFELETAQSNLSKEELDLGFHFCPDWDYMVVGPNDPESHACGCNIGSRKDMKGINNEP